MNENNSTSKCYVIGLKTYQNNEFEYVDRIMNCGYNKYSIFPDVPTIIEFKGKEFEQPETLLSSNDSLVYVSYCSMPQTISYVIAEDEIPINVEDSRYNKNLIPGYLGGISQSSLLNGTRLMYHKIDISYTTNNQRVMPMELSLGLGRIIAYDLMREIFEDFNSTHCKKDETGETIVDEDGSKILIKLRFCIDILEKHYGGHIMVESRLGKMLDRIIAASKNEALDCINILCGIVEHNEVEYGSSGVILGKVLSYIQAVESRSTHEKIELAKYFSNVDTWKLQAMDSVTKVNDKKNKLITDLTSSGKLEEYLNLYEEYFNKSRELAVSKVQVLEDKINNLIGHAATKKQIKMAEIDEVYDAAIDVTDLAEKESRPKELTAILKDIKNLSTCHNEDELNRLASMLKVEKSNCIVGLCNTKLNEITFKN